MQFSLPTPVRQALTLLDAAGYQAYLVGGCVRDMLRLTPPHDYDMTTSALPEETLAVFRQYRTIETGLKHGTVTVLIDGMPIEITTFRIDGEYTDHRRPEHVTFTPSLREDLARRDFTINAMAYHPTEGLIDPFSGQADLAAGYIRAVGEPKKRFSEDALRILRALRFAARLGFRIEEETGKAARALASTLGSVAAERVREEIIGLLLAPFADAVIAEYADVLAVVIPEGRINAGFSQLSPDPAVKLASFLLSAGNDAARARLLALRMDGETLREALALIHLFEAELLPCRALLCRFLRHYGPDTLTRALLLRRAHGKCDDETVRVLSDILGSGDCYTLSSLAVKGADIISLGILPGPRIGELLEIAYSAVIKGDVPNEREALLAFLVSKL